MKHAKQSKLLAMLLAVIMVLTMLPAVVLAAESEAGTKENPWPASAEGSDVVAYYIESSIPLYRYHYSYADGNSGTKNGSSGITPLTWEESKAADPDIPQNAVLDTNKTEVIQGYDLIFEGTGEIKDFSASIRDKELWGLKPKRTAIVKVQIGEGITRIGDHAFDNIAICDVSFPSTLKSIGKNAFCWSLYDYKTGGNYTLKLPDSCAIVEDAAFSRVSGISEVCIPASMTHISNHAFSNCKNLKSLKFSEGLVRIGVSAFENCSALEELVLPQSIESMSSWAFRGCSKLVYADLSQVTSLLGGEAVTKGIFKGCSNLKTLKLNASLSTIPTDLPFENADSIETIVIGSNVSTLPEKVFATIAQGSIIYSISDVLSKSYYDENKTSLACTNGGTFAENTVFEAGKLAAPIKKGYIFDGWYTKDGANNDWGDKITAAPTAGKTYYAKWAEKTLPSISFKDGLKLDKTYDGQAVSLSSDDYIVTAGAGNVTFAYQAKDGGGWKDIDTAPKNAGIYQVKAIAVESDTHKRAETGWKEFAISKAAPTYTSPTGLTAAVGQTLADVTLPEGFTWQDAAASVGDAGIKTFKATFTPKDTVNYHTVTIDLSLTVQPNPATKPPKTGDTSHSLLWTALLLVSGGTVLALLLKRKRQNI